jgi:hypothetical protein
VSGGVWCSQGPRARLPPTAASRFPGPPAPRRRYQHALDQTVIHVVPRWLGLAGLLALYALRVYYAKGWYIVTYGLGISLLNQFIGFISPQVRPAAAAQRGGAGCCWPGAAARPWRRAPIPQRHATIITPPAMIATHPQIDPDAAGSDGPLLPINGSEEFRPFRRRVPEFQFWCVSGRDGGAAKCRASTPKHATHPYAPLHSRHPAPAAAGTRRSGRRACAL